VTKVKKEILLIAYDRPHYLREVVDGIKALCGRREWTVTASIDMLPNGTHHDEVVQIAGEIANTILLQPERLDCNKHARVALTNALENSADCLLYIEDDVVPAPDTLEWCESNMAILEANPRIKGMTLLGESHGDVHVAWRNRHGFKAHRWFNAWGNFWTRAGLGEVLTHWPVTWDAIDAAWDARLLGQYLDNEWLSLTPLLGRVKNIGETGRYCTGAEEFRRRQRDYWAGSDFTRPIAANFR
jgi:hypothetical protein